MTSCTASGSTRRGPPDQLRLARAASRPGWDAAVRTAVRRAVATAGPRALWRDHRLFTILAVLSLVPRLLAALAFRPALMTSDSLLYMQESSKWTLGEIRPSGYSFFLAPLHYIPHPLLAVTTVQHLMGIAIAAIVYGLLRYWGLPAWGATLAALPTLFDTREIALESYILPDTLFTLCIMLAVALLITKRTPRLWQFTLAGLLLAYVTVLRANGIPLAVVAGIYLLIRRVGWRGLAAGVAAFAIPVLVYVMVFHSQYGAVQHHQQRRHVPVVRDDELRQLRDHQAPRGPAGAVPEPAEVRRGARVPACLVDTGPARRASARRLPMG